MRPIFILILALFAVDATAQPANDELHAAAAAGDVAKIRRLLAEGAAPESQSTNREPAVVAAVRNGHAEAARLLMEAEGMTLVFADDLLEVMLEKGEGELAELWWSLVAREPKLAESMFAGEAQEGHLRAMKFLLEKGVPADAPSGIGDTPLMFAIRMQQVDAVRFLLEQGADADRDYEVTGDTILTMAVFDGGPEILDLVLARTPRLNQVTSGGETALGMAAQFGFEGAIERLLRESGIDTDARDGQGKTPLMHAAETGCDRCALLLLGGGADRALEDREGRTAAAIAREAGFEPLAELIEGGRPDFEESLASDEHPPATDAEKTWARNLLTEWLVRRNAAAVFDAMAPEFRSTTAERYVEFEGISTDDANRRLVGAPHEEGSNCAPKCARLEECMKAVERPGEAFDIGFIPVDSQIVAGFPAASEHLGESLLGFGGALDCGLGFVFIATRGETPKLLALEYRAY
ncbi:MAG: ankyrin repeat domain-containing protein [Acidobacteria bacterium]|nr:ankyrin repeat domain-containing protein [Acidobacteriota bacterium]